MLPPEHVSAGFTGVYLISIVCIFAHTFCDCMTRVMILYGFSVMLLTMFKGRAAGTAAQKLVDIMVLLTT